MEDTKLDYHIAIKYRSLVMNSKSIILEHRSNLWRIQDQASWHGFEVQRDFPTLDTLELTAHISHHEFISKWAHPKLQLNYIDTRSFLIPEVWLRQTNDCPREPTLHRVALGSCQIETWKGPTRMRRANTETKLKKAFIDEFIDCDTSLLSSNGRNIL